MFETSFPDRCVLDERSCPTQGSHEKFPANRKSSCPPPPHAVRASGPETSVPSQARNLHPSPHTRVGLDNARSVLLHRSHSREPIRFLEEARRSGPAKAFHRECSPIGGPGPTRQRGVRKER